MAFSIKFRLQFEGDEADLNRLPAHDGMVSLEGMSWSFSLLANYLATGKIKKSGVMSTAAMVYIEPARKGSFINDLIVHVSDPDTLFMTKAVGHFGAATLSAVFGTFVGYALKSVTGQQDQLTSQERRWLAKFPKGDVEAMIDAVEASIKRAHTVIGEGATTLNIKKSTTSLLTLDDGTKSYVNANIPGLQGTTKIVGVGAYDANSGNGRVFLHGVGKTVSFHVDGKHVSATTRQAISKSLDRYVNERPSEIEVVCDEILALDGRIRKLKIHKAKWVLP